MRWLNSATCIGSRCPSDEPELLDILFRCSAFHNLTLLLPFWLNSFTHGHHLVAGLIAPQMLKPVGSLRMSHGKVTIQSKNVGHHLLLRLD
jgi:hypothetical protein